MDTLSGVPESMDNSGPMDNRSKSVPPWDYQGRLDSVSGPYCSQLEWWNQQYSSRHQGPTRCLEMPWGIVQFHTLYTFDFVIPQHMSRPNIVEATQCHRYIWNSRLGKACTGPHRLDRCTSQLGMKDTLQRSFDGRACYVSPVRMARVLRPRMDNNNPMDSSCIPYSPRMEL